MTSQMGSGPSPVARSFAEHLRSFHAGLPEDEQKLLERVFALAESVADQMSGDVQGYAIDAFMKFAPVSAGFQKLSPNLLNLLAPPGVS